MSIELAMPKLGLTMKTGKVSKWFVAEGAMVKQGDDLFEVETDKITNKVESPADGVLFQILVQPKQEVAVGAVLGVIAEPGENPARVEGGAASSPEGAVDAASPAAAQKSTPAAAQPPRSGGRAFSSPAARRLACELDVDIACVVGSGPEGRILERDVRARFDAVGKIKITPLAAVVAARAGLDIATLTGTGEGGKIVREDVERALHPEKFAAQEAKAPAGAVPRADGPGTVPMEGMRKIIADNMQASLQNSAQLTLVSEADVTACVGIIADLRARHKKDKDFRLSMNDVLILAVSRALKKHPRMNATLDGDTITRHAEVHMGVAVALPEGLVVPVLHNADGMGLLRIASEARLLAGRARKGGLTPDDMSGGTFTITNMAHSVVDFFTPILKPGETGILGLGRVTEKAVVRNGAIVVRSMMGLSLTFDHRVEDGAPAAEFLKTLTEFLAEPALLLF
ncbi:2-oxo acid dehydrogenase subunit E2 [Desulfovibrio sp. 86]|uniref:Dihydrolipoamide acetyltransferase component of pyruvate dehydrogenase complex n=1 Tax=uncultured Desulfovibrio sp. TaxID=167968 RepID=A0A212LAJ2_9BACT|nr:2-oxo acid dehydrogenase subunit E2 [Desulfovibrio sp. 86]SCM74349.1 Pyruvate/2-oxoglutarate dehydrogenase complex, dihydrolipoamide acyltransferase component [uncultured Desulfovibrio sp.]VZH34780.1 Dihydrolipoamide acetyltransferase component of pyruvate dehydrogenase complex [Desulfovibrio sp. 86]